MKRYLPIIIANGREYCNVHYDTKEEAEKALEEFIEIFRSVNDSRIERTFVQEV